MLKLPKSLEAHPHHKVLAAFLQNQERPIYGETACQVPVVEMSPALSQALSFARRCGRLRGGLESIEQHLQNEKQGLESTAVARQQKSEFDNSSVRLDSSASTTDSARANRLLLMSDDGSERFYRACESLLGKHAQRVQGVRLKVSGTDLAKLFFGRPGAVRAMLVDRKEFVEKVLLSLAPDSQTSVLQSHELES